MEVLSPKYKLSYISVYTLRGLIELDTLEAEKVLVSFREGLVIRESLLPPDDTFIASSLNTISLVHTELR